MKASMVEHGPLAQQLWTLQGGSLLQRAPSGPLHELPILLLSGRKKSVLCHACLLQSLAQRPFSLRVAMRESLVKVICAME